MIYKKKFILLIIFFLFTVKNIYAVENKILIKVNNEIITSLDVLNEIDFLTLLNPDFTNLNKKKKIEISKNSIIKEIIKKIQISKNVKKMKVDDRYIDTIIESTYQKLGFENLKQFNTHLIERKISIKDLKKKFIIQALWNELIFIKFSSKLKINKSDLKEKIKKNNLDINKTYLLSEIIFNADSKPKFNEKYEMIKKTIETEGFENAALIFGISDSSKLGGKLGWINENSIGEKIKKEIFQLKIDEYSKPIIIPSGFLIVKINDIKETKIKINVEKELEKLIRVETNNQLNQFSNIYFNKIKKDILINEL